MMGIPLYGYSAKLLLELSTKIISVRDLLKMVKSLMKISVFFPSDLEIKDSVGFRTLQESR